MSNMYLVTTAENKKRKPKYSFQENENSIKIYNFSSNSFRVVLDLIWIQLSGKASENCRKVERSVALPKSLRTWLYNNDQHDRYVAHRICRGFITNGLGVLRI